MSLVKTIRTQLGLTQETMGKILGIKRTYLASVERGTRKLPESVRPVLNWMEGNPILLQTPELEPASLDSIQKILRQLRNEKARLEMALEQRREKEIQLYQTHLICEELRHHYPNRTRGMELHLESIGYDAGLELEKLRATPTLRLQARIRGIEAEIQALESGTSSGQ